MSGVHWSDSYVEWIVRTFPEIDRPVYVRASNEIPANIWLAGSVAFTQLHLDLQLRDTIESKGRWRGRGFAICVNAEVFWTEYSDDERFGILLHELGHSVCHGKRQWLERDEMPLLEAASSFGGNDQLVKAALGMTTEAEILANVRCKHGPRFLRAGLHLWHRARHSVTLDSLMLFSPYYGSPGKQASLEALHLELVKGGDLFEILQAEPPSEFADLFVK